MNKKVALAGAVIGLAVVSTATPVSAQQYGGTPNASVSLNKMVQDPSTGIFVDNLGLNTARFQAGQDVVYRIDVNNRGDQSFGYVDVTDTLPSFLDFVSGPGNFNPSNRQVTFRLDNVTPGSTQSREIRARVVAQNQLPNNDGVFCVVNNASLTTNTGQTSSDNAQICIGNGNKVLGTTTTIKALPATGVETYALAASLITIIGAGVALRKARY